MSETQTTVGIIGAGTMGAGIAQVALIGGWTVRLMDVDEATVRGASETITQRLERLVEKERLTREQCDESIGRLHLASDPVHVADCSLVLEAIVEDLSVKTRVLGEIVPHLSDEAIIATNTSSLSVTKIGEAIGEPRRTAGMHFFNPAPLMKLVEVVAGAQTDTAVVDRVAEIASSWGKQVARAADVPGFIVNHVARPYYLEAFRILEDGQADVTTIDRTMTKFGGFRMGPLALTDLIGQDVNTATTRSVWEQLDHPPLLHPSRLQEQLVADERLGRKVGRGVYDYSDDLPRPALDVAHEPPTISAALRDVVDRFVSAAIDRGGSEVERYVFARILVAVIAQAALARERGVAEQDDIDTALKYGVNYPHGPFDWMRRIGVDRCAELLEALNETVNDERFAVPDLLREHV
jgi:3-hydroxybutyryl-CoA dehydrogenase